MAELVAKIDVANRSRAEQASVGAPHNPIPVVVVRRFILWVIALAENPANHGSRCLDRGHMFPGRKRVCEETKKLLLTLSPRWIVNRFEPVRAAGSDNGGKD